MITENTTMLELKALCNADPSAAAVLDFCGFPRVREGDGNKPLSEAVRHGWQEWKQCANYALAAAETGSPILSLYPENEPASAETGLMLLGAENRNPTVLIVPGGGYNMVSTVDDGIRIAIELNRLGYPAAVLRYRIRRPGVFREAMEDLTQAVRLLTENNSPYLLAGFSSGGHMSLLWAGNSAYGAAAAGLPAPAGVLLAYPLVSISRKAIILQYGLDIYRDLRGIPTFMENLLGTGWGMAEAEALDAEKYLDASCPPVYSAHGRMDTAVFCSNSELLGETLEGLGVPYRLRYFDSLAHAFSSGEGTEAAGWLADAVHFLEEVKK